MKEYMKEYDRWLSSSVISDEERRELELIKGDNEVIELRFSQPMSFGTAGLRSTMYMGIGCMNRFTVAQATRGIAELVKRSGGETRGVCIACDSRNNSELFSRVAASVLAGAGIKVYIFDGIRPTPELSFAVRSLSCIAGINITASHNPKEYNGYKAYWEDGAQINPEQASIVSDAISKFDPLDVSSMLDFDEGVESGIIEILGEEMDNKYLDAVVSTSVNSEAVKRAGEDFCVVYTPLHGAGYKLVPAVFERIGLCRLFTVDEQMIPDGNFPTVEKPNPEYEKTFKLGISLADKVGSDLVIATDPDSDRVGVAARGKDGEFVTISGNKMGALLLDFVIKSRLKNGTLPDNAYCVKSLVSTDMASAIAKKHGIRIYDVLTGFKFIGEVIKNYEERGEKDGFLLGFEESYGYLLGSYARDKDAVGAAMIILEMTAYYKSLGMTLIDALYSLYEEYGYYTERTVDIYLEGLDGIAKRKSAMENLRKSKCAFIGDYSVTSIEDLLISEIYNTSDKKTVKSSFQRSDVIIYTLDSGDKIIVRPSGTEPKIKIYALLNGEDIIALDKKADILVSNVKAMMDL